MSRSKLKTCPKCGAGYLTRHSKADCDWYRSIPPDSATPTPAK